MRTERKRSGLKGLLVFVLLLAAHAAFAQYAPIPNYGPGGAAIPDQPGNAGYYMRRDINNRFSGLAPIAPLLVQLNFAQLPTSASNGQLYYVVDGSPGVPCSGGGSGAIAKRVGGIWSCTETPPGGAAAPTSVSCYHKTTLVGTGSFISGSTNYSGSFQTPNTTTDMDNCVITFSAPSPNNRVCDFEISTADGSEAQAGVSDVSTTTTAKVDFASAGGTSGGLDKLTITYGCLL